MVNIAINGLGRIGRLVLRATINEPEINIVRCNSPAEIETIAHLITYDSVHGKANFSCAIQQNKLIVNDKQIAITHHREPELIPLRQNNIDLVVECSGKFNTRNMAAKFLQAGAKKVIISAPCADADATIVIGINQHILETTHEIVSLGSCTTNALAPIVTVLNDACGIEQGYVTTIHAYTGDQNLVDNSHSDIRRARSAPLSMIPTKTGAAEALKLVIPEMAGKLAGSAIRVPTPNVSLIDLVFTANRDTNISEINDAMKDASAGKLKDILGIAPAKLVSCDFNHTSYSAVFDPYETHVVNNKLVRVVSWYDNEWAFALRVTDSIKLLKNLM